MRRLTALLVVIVVAVGLLALPAAATSVSADCGGNGYFSSTGYAEDWQRHTKGGSQVDFLYSGYRAKTKYWGWYAGTQYATVIGYNLQWANARCVS